MAIALNLQVNARVTMSVATSTVHQITSVVKIVARSAVLLLKVIKPAIIFSFIFPGLLNL